MKKNGDAFMTDHPLPNLPPKGKERENFPTLGEIRKGVLSLVKVSCFKLLVTSIIATLAITSCNVGTRKTNDIEKDSVKKFTLTEVWRTDTVLLTPESVVYDRHRDILYVSNVNQEPRMKDNNGFISRIDRNGNIVTLRWIEGLSSPKGLTIVGDTLYAADVDEVVMMDINKGEIIRKLSVNGSRMLNDITSDSTGTIYFSDTDANRIYKLKNGKIEEWLAEGLVGPNGLLLKGDTLFLALQGANNFASVEVAEKKFKVLTDSIIHADGIAYTGIPGYYLVTNWDGEIYLINPDFTRSSLLRTKKEQINTADIEYIPEYNLLVVPTFFGNCVIAYRLEEKTGGGKNK
jgi:sugar lactone lactonase YvrE